MVLDSNSLRIGIYVGEGASHSWTWFVDLFEKYGYQRIRFLEEKNFPWKALEQDLLIVSGGDTFAVADALASSGAQTLQAFLKQGGLYVGSCAGAYLPLNSSKQPLNSFNFVKAKINNLTRDLPPAHRLPLKFSSRYGCSYVFHPVRDEVRIRMVTDPPVWSGDEIRVPLYGGPPLNLSEDVLPRAYYSGFTERTVFLTDPEIAKDVYLDKIAACEKQIDKGRMLLLGPHFEHPWFPDGNEIIHKWIQQNIEEKSLKEINKGDNREAFKKRPAPSASGLRALKLAVSNMRIRAQALARESIHWQIGAKIYEPEKIVHFLETIWKRLGSKNRLAHGADQACDWEALADRAEACHTMLKALDQQIRDEIDSQELAIDLFRLLKGLVVSFLEIYFVKESSELT